MCWVLPLLALNAQDTLYHTLDPLKEEPWVLEWNVSKRDALSSKNYIMEVTDSVGRPTALYFYYNGLNRRTKIDDMEIVTFTYDDNAIDIYSRYSRETDYSMWIDESFRCLHYHVVFDDSHRMTDFVMYSFVDTLRKREYYHDTKAEEGRSVLLEEYHGLEACKEIEIPYMRFFMYDTLGFLQFRSQFPCERLSDSSQLVETGRTIPMKAQYQKFLSKELRTGTGAFLCGNFFYDGNCYVAFFDYLEEYPANRLFYTHVVIYNSVGRILNEIRVLNGSDEPDYFGDWYVNATTIKHMYYGPYINNDSYPVNCKETVYSLAEDYRLKVIGERQFSTVKRIVW